MSRYDDLLDLISDPGEECIEWPYAHDPRGYGCVWIDGKLHRATHVAMNEAGIFPVGKQLCALHSCDNPPCVNPNHLTWGTKGENSRQMVERKRGTAKLLPEHIPVIRRLLEFDLPVTAIANVFNVRQSTISAIKSGQNWAHIQ